MKLKNLQDEIIITLCQFEMYFPPSFFDIMVHLVVHLVREIQLCGPAFLRYMYPIERYMKILKGYVNNRSHPEGCIVERALIDESMEFCINYLANVDATGILKPRHSRGLEGKGISACKVLSMPRAIMNQVHLCVLHNSSEVRPYEKLHLDYLKKQYPHKSEKWRIEEYNRTFIDRFQTQISEEFVLLWINFL